MSQCTHMALRLQLLQARVLVSEPFIANDVAVIVLEGLLVKTGDMFGDRFKGRTGKQELLLRSQGARKRLVFSGPNDDLLCI